MNRSDLIAAIGRGRMYSFHTFWGGPFSQWSVSKFYHQGDEYVTAEHFMMVQKARLFGDKKAEEIILSNDHPRAAKDAGRQVKGYIDEVWAAHRYNAVLLGSFLKFTNNKGHFDSLMDTGKDMLVEASPEDRIWGVGWAPPDPRAKDPRQWNGDNLLGFVLTQVRDCLRGIK